MSYKSYRARVERQRARLKAALEHANALRDAAQLPTRNVEAELDHHHRLMTKIAWIAHQQERQAFAHFKRGRLAGMVMPTPSAGSDWEQVRALSLRRAYLEHQIERAWLARGTPRSA